MSHRWRAFQQPAFLIAVLVLATSAASLNAAVNFARVYFRKQPVELTRPLTTISATLGSWRQVSRDEALTPEVQDVLGTDQYVFRRYVNERIVGPEMIQSLLNPSLSDGERSKLLGDVYRRHPEALVSLAVTYYTGLADTVPHIPERCVVADGYEPTPTDNIYPMWDVPGRGPTEVRFINFEDQTGANRQPRSIAYLFHVNGHYEASPLGVRATLQNLLETHAYYAKVEVMTLLDDQQRSATMMSDFLGSVLPEVERALPDWERVTGADDR